MSIYDSIESMHTAVCKSEMPVVLDFIKEINIILDLLPMLKNPFSEHMEKLNTNINMIQEKISKNEILDEDISKKFLVLVIAIRSIEKHKNIKFDDIDYNVKCNAYTDVFFSYTKLL